MNSANSTSGQSPGLPPHTSSGGWTRYENKTQKKAPSLVPPASEAWQSMLLTAKSLYLSGDLVEAQNVHAAALDEFVSLRKPQAELTQFLQKHIWI